ncbi:hypothetical protein G3T36_08470 [Diaminobutyricibacter tongyongensis]|uniref:Glycoside hydrolase family 42 N-terminal domain-containing protein n=1 Tax=Leifsonia tongyongensis TaxID=1268043 RepID=A0A6L9XXG6_9MICO|nr:hypothetical protein [Diaminobutyricibacter tongyongensis]NEN05907.1 hypothetical protein [Diaminobutyricibacter tongyongensis]
MAPARELGATLIRVYVYWSQVEPRPGEYDWQVVDGLIAQLEPDDQAWITVCSSSPWGTRVPTDFQPPSPALYDEAYERFVSALVQRFGGRVRYWQCNNEQSNHDLLWSGNTAEYAHQLAGFARAVRTADPAASVVLGGCGYDALSSRYGSDARRCYETLAATSGADFDVFSLNLYGDPYRIPEHIAWARSIMQANGYEHPIVVGEYNGPTLFEFADANASLEAAMIAAFIGMTDGAHIRTESMSTVALAERVVTETPDRRALRQLYRMEERLPPSLRMFMHDAPDYLIAQRHRIARRQLVQRVALIRAEGVDTMACWNLAPEVGDYSDPLNIMDLMFGSLALMNYRNGRISKPHPEAETHQLVATRLTDARFVEPLAADAHALVFRVDHGRDRESVLAWLKTDDPMQEDRERRRVSIRWSHGLPTAVDAFGEVREIVWDEAGQTISLDLTATPVFIALSVRGGRHVADPGH